MSGASFGRVPRMTVEQWEAQAARRGAPPDRDGEPVKDVHIRFNAWEHEHMMKLAKRDCQSLQRLIRSTMRKLLLEEFPK